MSNKEYQLKIPLHTRSNSLFPSKGINPSKLEEMKFQVKNRLSSDSLKSFKSSLYKVSSNSKGTPLYTKIQDFLTERVRRENGNIQEKNELIEKKEFVKTTMEFPSINKAIQNILQRKFSRNYSKTQRNSLTLPNSMTHSIQNSGEPKKKIVSNFVFPNKKSSLPENSIRVLPFNEQAYASVASIKFKREFSTEVMKHKSNKSSNFNPNPNSKGNKPSFFQNERKSMKNSFRKFPGFPFSHLDSKLGSNLSSNFKIEKTRKTFEDEDNDFEDFIKRLV